MDIDRDRDKVVDAGGSGYTVRSIDRSGGTAGEWKVLDILGCSPKLSHTSSLVATSYALTCLPYTLFSFLLSLLTQQVPHSKLNQQNCS